MHPTCAWWDAHRDPGAACPRHTQRPPPLQAEDCTPEELTAAKRTLNLAKQHLPGVFTAWAARVGDHAPRAAKKLNDAAASQVGAAGAVTLTALPQAAWHLLPDGRSDRALPPPPAPPPDPAAPACMATHAGRPARPRRAPQPGALWLLSAKQETQLRKQPGWSQAPDTHVAGYVTALREVSRAGGQARRPPAAPGRLPAPGGVQHGFPGCGCLP
jgi:hypothetical protein